MSDELDTSQIAELLKRRLIEQENLRKKFDQSGPANEYKDDIDLGENYRPTTEFRMDRDSFYIEHTPTKLINQWSVMTGPKALKRGVEGWVDEMEQTFSIN